MVNVFAILGQARALKASGLALFAGHPPMATSEDSEIPMAAAPLACDTIHTMLDSLMTPAQRRRFRNTGGVRFGRYVAGVGRIRVFAVSVNGCPGLTIRFLPSTLFSLEELGLGHVFRALDEINSGLILVTGPTGSGKSTTLASMVDHLNTHKSLRIVTIEDPIEYIHEWKASVIRQCECPDGSVAEILNQAVDQDVDVIVVGNLSNQEAVTLALIAAETGHLVLGALNTANAKETVEGIIQLYPFEEKAMIRSMLSDTLQAVVSQRMIVREDGQQIAAKEIMMATPEIQGIIRRNELDALYAAIQGGAGEGMNKNRGNPRPMRAGKDSE